MCQKHDLSASLGSAAMRTQCSPMRSSPFSASLKSLSRLVPIKHLHAKRCPADAPLFVMLSADLQAKLTRLMNQPSTAACVDALLSVCEMPPTPRDFPLGPSGHASNSNSHGNNGSSSTSMPASPLARPPAMYGGGDLHSSLPRLNINASPQRSLQGHGGAHGPGLSMHRHSAGLSPVGNQFSHIGISTPRKRKADEAAAALAASLEASPSAMLAHHSASVGGCGGGNCESDYNPSLLERLHGTRRAALCRAALGITDDMIISPRAFGAAPRSMPSPRRRKTGPPSSRDKVWDLLTATEKDQILSDQISAAEGTKALLERRAAQLGCAVGDMPDDDDWEIGFKLTECKATSEPLAKPKTCSICLRYASCECALSWCAQCLEFLSVACWSHL
jgi:hypothetical protein